MINIIINIIHSPAPQEEAMMCGVLAVMACCVNYDNFQDGGDGEFFDILLL